MRLLLDTHILLALASRTIHELGSAPAAAVTSSENQSFASAASLWEIAIKTRIGKLKPALAPDRMPAYFRSLGLTLLVVDHVHAVTAADPEPPTRDPFDRLLLSQCLVENLRLVTLDRALAAHPLAWRPD
jgi:PIN domain nuclease of toxin-antitoxin system